MSPRSKEAFLKLKEETKNKIEYSAVTLFAKHGLAVTVSQIAKHAGISQGLIYQHYESKDALIFALVNKALTLSSSYIKQITDMPVSAEEKIKLISEMMLNMLLAPDSEGTKLFLFMLQFGMSMPTDSFSENEAFPPDSPVEYLVKIIMQGQADGTVKPGSPVSMALIYWAAVQGLCCFSLTGTPVPAEAELLSQILLK